MTFNSYEYLMEMSSNCYASYTDMYHTNFLQVYIWIKLKLLKRHQRAILWHTFNIVNLRTAKPSFQSYIAIKVSLSVIKLKDFCFLLFLKEITWKVNKLTICTRLENARKGSFHWHYF